ncbi:MAG TPA: hypothetical protein VFZ91_04310 [Allosphingosinicella sp.]
MLHLFRILAAAVAASQIAAPLTAAVAPAQRPAASIFIPFDPPLGQRLIYRKQRIEEKPDGRERSEFTFAIEFRRDDDHYIMTLSPGGAEDRAEEPARMQAALSRRSFRMSPQGEIVGMIDEADYWTALEDTAERALGKGAGEVEAVGTRWAMRQTRELPLRERMHILAGTVMPILFYAGLSVDPEQPIERKDIQTTVLGPITGTARTTVERIARDHVTITRSWIIPNEQLQEAMDRLSERFGRRPYGLGSHLISSDNVQRFEIDRRTGLARSYRSVRSTVTQEGDQRPFSTVTEILERID